MIRTIVHVSDLHFGRIEPGTPEALLAAIESIEPDLVIASGDFTLRGTRNEFAQARDFVRAIGPPVLGVPGNHDIPVNAALRFTNPLGRYNQYLAPELVHSYTDEHMFVLGFNTARSWGWHWNWAHGRFSKSQLREADDAFNDHQHLPMRWLVAHHPFVVPDDMPGFKVVGRRSRMLRIIKQRRVGLILCGHLHTSSWHPPAEEQELGSHHYVVVQASTATSPRRRGHANAFNVLEVSGKAVRLRPMTWDGNTFTRGEAEILHAEDGSLETADAAS